MVGPSRRERLGLPSLRLLAPVALLVATGVATPMVYVFLRAFAGGADSYLRVVTSGSTLRLLANTLLLVVGVVAVAIAVAVPLAWLVVRSDLPIRRLWGVLGALPLVFPSYVSAMCLVAALGPRGYAQSLLGVERLPGFVYGYFGGLLALGFFTYPYIYLLLVARLRSLDPALEESALTLGHGRGRIFFTVTLPQLRAPLLSGSLLVSLYVLSDFGAVSLVRYDTFTLSIYNAYRSLFDRSVAASLATVLVGMTVLFVSAEAFLERRIRSSPGRAHRSPRPVALGPFRWPAILLVSVLTLVTLVVPISVLVYWGGLSFAAPTFEVLDTLQSVLHSLQVSSMAAVLAVFLSIPVVVWALEGGSRLSSSIERLSYAGFALPGVVIALALVFTATRTVPVLYQTSTLLVVAYVIRFLPQAAAATRSALLGLSPAFAEAAGSLGRGGWSILATITFPLARQGLVMGGSLVFLTTMKELPATLILRPTGFETLATRIWAPASEGIYSEAGPAALMLLLVTAPLVYWLVIRPVLRISSEIPTGRS